MSQTTIIAFQAVLIFLQFVNTGVATVIKDPVISLLIGGALAGFQYFVNHLGNHSLSPEVSMVLTPEQKATLAENKVVVPEPKKDA